MNNLRIASYNCRSVKNSIQDVYNLCESHDIVCLQEHWLLPCDLHVLSSLHPDFNAYSHSAVDIGSNILVGRPYGGTGVLFRKDISHAVSIINTQNSRITAIKICSAEFSFAVVCVYMPTDYGDIDSMVDYVETCSLIDALMTECDVNQFCVIGDMNCQPGSRFFAALSQLASDKLLKFSDMDRLCNATTYYSNCGTRSSWIDHVMCTQTVDSSILSVSILDDYICSDHKPVSVQLACSVTKSVGNDCVSMRQHCCWNKVTDVDIANYQFQLDNLLHNVNLNDTCTQPICNDSGHHAHIDSYYNDIISCVQVASSNSIPQQQCGNEQAIAGWNDYVSDKHQIARAAFLEWCTSGKPMAGHLFHEMRRSRSAFKMALRFVKRHEEEIKADKCEQSLNFNDSAAFWKSVQSMSNTKATNTVTCVAGVSGTKNIANVWKLHFEKIYNTIVDVDTRDNVCELLSGCNDTYNVTVDMVKQAVYKQHRGKAAGHDGVYMESLIYACPRLFVHLTILLNECIKHSYLPEALMRSVIVPLIKNKNGDTSDLNNYRAIALSTVLSKVLESIILHDIVTHDEADMHQFGFKAGLSTTLCTNVCKNVINYYVNRGSHVFACFVDFTKAFDRVNYWKLFKQFIGDGVNMCIVNLLAYWYSNQRVCVRWLNATSDCFLTANGTRQGGLCSPYFFARYMRGLISSIRDTRIGCNIGGLFYNVLAYADDIILLAPSWQALQDLINVLHVQAGYIDMLCNTKKTCCMVFNPRCKGKMVSNVFRCFTLDGVKLDFVSSFKYLGHILTDTLSDDDDVKREIRNLFVRTNVLRLRYHKCSVRVKIRLFRSFCLCFYGLALWKTVTCSVKRSFKTCYNSCMKMFFGYKRFDSVTGMLIDLQLPSHATVLHNANESFKRCLSICENVLVKHMFYLGL